MAITIQQVQKQTQKLAMTPLMQQSLQLLQMPALELEQMALQEIEQNPFLEIAEDVEDDQASVEEDLAAGLESGSAEVEVDDKSSEGAEEPLPDPSVVADDSSGLPSEDEDKEEGVGAPGEAEVAHFDDVDVNWDECYDDADSPVYYARSSDEEEHDLEDYVAARPDLRQQLKWQLQMSVATDAERRIGEYIIGNLDSDGYLRVPIEEIAADLECKPQDVEKVLKLIQTFDPPGVAARSLEECLEIQLRNRKVKDPLAYEIVRKHLNYVKNKRIRALAQKLGVSEDRVAQVVNLISSLDPKPGARVQQDTVPYVEPDVIVKKIDDDYYIFVNEGRLSGLRLNGYYRTLLQSKDAFSEEERKFALEKFKAAVWLLKNLERRKATLLRVTQAIMEHQRGFLEHGVSALKPLTLRQIADEVGMHESTIARVTSGKYVETPRGLFELKYFFTRGVQQDSGEELSNETVRQLIKELVESEDPANPLSDQAIVAILRKRGINIARRTVAKYRAQLGILPSRLRKTIDSANKD